MPWIQTQHSYHIIYVSRSMKYANGNGRDCEGSGYTSSPVSHTNTAPMLSLQSLLSTALASSMHLIELALQPIVDPLE